MKTPGFGLSALLSFLLWAPEAAAHALTCTNADNYVYFIDDPAKAKKCRYSYNTEDCVITSNSLNCTWDPGSGRKAAASPKPPEQEKTSLPTAKPPTKTPSFNFSFSFKPTPPEAPEEEPTAVPPAPAPKPQPSYGGAQALPSISDPLKEQAAKEQAAKEQEAKEQEAKAAELAKKIKELEEAKKEAKISAGKVEELKLTMEEIKVNNENNAILYRSPDGNVGSVDPRFNAFNGGVSGEFNEAGASGSMGGGLLGNGLKDLFGKKRGAKDKAGRTLASDGSGEIGIGRAGDSSGASANGDGSSATSDNPWVSYMGQTTKAGLIDRLRKNPGLRDSLRDRIGELQAKGDQTGVIALMEEALAAAELESQGPNLDGLKPMSVMEAFSMDAAETAAQIRSLLADLDTPSDRQFLPQESLFERVSVAHRRSVVRGAIRTNR